MEIIYFSKELVEQAEFINRVLTHRYNDIKNPPVLDDGTMEKMKHAYIVLRIPLSYDAGVLLDLFTNDEFRQSSTIIRTHENYYMNIPMNIVIEEIFTGEFKTLFAEDLYQAARGVLINPYRSKDRLRKVRQYSSFPYILRRFIIMSDLRDFNHEYMRIYDQYKDLDRDDLNRLMKLTIHYIVPIDELSELRQNDNLMIDDNGMCQYNGRLYSDVLDNKDDMSTSVPIPVTKLTNYPTTTECQYTTMWKFLGHIYDLYQNPSGEYAAVAPVSTLVDTFVTISMDDINNLQASNSNIRLIYETLLFRNKAMHFAFNVTSKDYQKEGGVS